MKTVLIVLSVLLAGCSREGNPRSVAPAETNAIVVVAQDTPEVSTSPTKPLPTWYVFKVKQFRKVTHSDDKTIAICEGVTMQDREFNIKLVWDESFKEAHPKTIDGWLKRSKGEFDTGIPYVIAGEVVSRDPLTIKPDTVVANGDKFGAPAENVY